MTRATQSGDRSTRTASGYFFRLPFGIYATPVAVRVVRTAQRPFAERASRLLASGVLREWLLPRGGGAQTETTELASGIFMSAGSSRGVV